jgi:ABC-type glycerol-3-phosphate transport system substrate-binding protein
VRTRLLIAIVLFAVLVLPAFGEGQKDAAGREVTILVGADWKFVDFGIPIPDTGEETLFAKLFNEFTKETGATGIFKPIDFSTGSSISIDSLVASGQAPDVYSDYAGRASKYMDPGYALALDGYLAKEIPLYDKTVMATLKRDGKVYALPNSAWVNGFTVNLDILKEVGYTLPAQKDWTIDEFLKLAALIKAKAPGKYVTVLFAKNQSSEEWWKIWFYAFGASMYKPGDYTKTTLNSPQGVATLRFFQQMLDMGYVPPDAAVQDDDTALDLWARGKVAFLSMQVNHTGAMDTAVKSGVLAKPFEIAFIEMPHAKGVAHVPYTAGPGIAVVHKTDDEARNKLAARLAWWFTGTMYQKYSVIQNKGFPTIAGVETVDNPLIKQVAAVKKAAGVADWGLTMQKFSEVRAQMFPLMAEMYMGKKTPEAVLSQYEATVNKILAGK